MYDIVIIAVGGIKSTSTRSLCEDYLKRCAPFARVRVIEVPAEPFKNEAVKEKSKKKEGERMINILKKYEDDAHISLLDASGTQYTSESFAEDVMHGESTHIFVVGGALGFSKEIRAKKFKTLSLSKMTFPHEIARMLLLEQIYRGITITKGKAYHY